MTINIDGNSASYNRPFRPPGPTTESDWLKLLRPEDAEVQRFAQALIKHTRGLRAITIELRFSPDYMEQEPSSRIEAWRFIREDAAKGHPPTFASIYTEDKSEKTKMCRELTRTARLWMR